MKKGIFMFLVITIFMNFSLTAFANEKKIDSSVYNKNGKTSREELKTVIGTQTYNVVLDGKKTEKYVTIKEHSKKCLDYISLKNLTESLNGYIKCYPEYYSLDGKLGSRFLGDFELLGEKFNFRTCNNECIVDDDKLIDHWMLISTDIENKNVILNMSNYDEELSIEIYDNEIYVSMEFLTRIFSRLGYMCVFDKDTKTFNIQKYDIEKEKKLMLEKFPEEKFKKIPYRVFENSEPIYEDIRMGERAYILYDVFDKFAKKTTGVEYLYREYIGYNYKLGYKINENIETALRGMLEAWYMTHFDNICIKYDEDLDAYIVCNKKFENIDDIDDTSKFLVVRKFDYMILN